MNDTRLEDLLSTAGAAYEVPEDAFARVLAAAGESAAPARRRFEHPRLVAAGVLLVAAVGSTFLWSGHDGRSASLLGAGPSAVDFQVGQGRAPLGTLHGPSAGSATGSAGDVVKSFSTENGTAGAPAAGAKAAPGLSREQGATTGSLDGSSSTDGAATVDGAKIVHTGTLTLSVAQGQVSATLTQVTGLATGVDGYVSSSTTAESGRRPSGTVVLRVPAFAYDSVLTQARALGTVISTTSQAQDVTAQAADQQARLTALKASRNQFLTILAKAKTIGETLAVQQRVDDAQTQIDQLQGQINVLASQASYGTLSVSVSQKSPAAVPAKPTHRQSGLSKAWHSAVTGFVTGVEALVARSGRALVVLLVLLVLAGLGRTVWRVGRRRLV